MFADFKPKLSGGARETPYLFLGNIVSTGLGPTIVGAASDFFGRTMGNDALRYSLLVIVTSTTLWSALHFLLASRTLRADLARTRE